MISNHFLPPLPVVSDALKLPPLLILKIYAILFIET